MYFSQNFFKNRAYHSYDEGEYTKKYMISEEFSIKIHEKSRKHENYQNSFDKVIDNHIYVPETRAHSFRVIQTPINREKCVYIIKWIKIPRRDILLLDINDIWSELQ